MFKVTFLNFEPYNYYHLFFYIVGEGSVDTASPNDHEVHVKTFFITLDVLVFTTGASSA